jgi:aminopeptidase N
LQEQLVRIKNPDRINRFKIIMKAASSDQKPVMNFLTGLHRNKTDPMNQLLEQRWFTCIIH